MSDVLTAAAIAAASSGLPDWRYVDDHLLAASAAATVAAALDLVAGIGAAAEQLDHHPDVDWRYDHVFVATTSHDVGGRVTRRDLALAARITALARTAPVTAVPGMARVGA